MYGGGYSNYGSYGGGYGGYGSSYGGYGSYGSGYGSYGMNRTTSLGTLPNAEQQINNDPNAPQQPPINERKHVIQEYFKMMGGLRSMVQLGFSMVALCNFGSKSWELLKKIVGFLAKTSKKLYLKLSGTSVVAQKMGQVFQKAMMISPNSKNGNTTLNKILTALRIGAAIMLMLTIKLKSNLKQDVEKQHDKILSEFEDIKLEEKKIEQKQRHQMDFNLYQKQGYF